MLLCGSNVLKTSKIVWCGLTLAGLVSCAIPAGDSISSPPAVPILPAAPPGGDSVPRVEGNPILDDPEQQTAEWEDYVWADSPRSAWQKCRDLAKRHTDSGGTTVDVKRVRESGRGRYRCIFEG